jgi:hypothetical protein
MRTFNVRTTRKWLLTKLLLLRSYKTEGNVRPNSQETLLQGKRDLTENILRIRLPCLVPKGQASMRQPVETVRQR